MLKGVDPLLSPELLHTLASMGHGDRLVVVDTNYPAYSGPPRVHRLDGVPVTEVVRAILTLFPLDTFVDHPLERMAVVGSADIPDVQREVLALAIAAAGRELPLASLERGDFYASAATAFAVVVSGERRPYGCFILTKGVLPEFTPEPEAS